MEVQQFLNNLDKSDKGPWTWIDRKDNNIKSCLDIAIASTALVPYVVNFEVDRERKFTPRRVIRKKDMITEIFTDHFSLKIELSGMPKNKNESKPAARQNVNKPGGWSIYERITDEIADKINSIVDNDKITIDEAIKRIETLKNNVDFKALGKTTHTKKSFDKVPKVKYMGNMEILDVQTKTQKNKSIR